MDGEGSRDEGKLNVKFYDNGNGFINIEVENSLQITDNVEQREILKLITKSKYYSEDTYGDIDFMQAQWFAHNLCYSLAQWGGVFYKAAQWLSGADDPIKSSETVDLRPKNNMGRRARALYVAISKICHGTPKYFPVSYLNQDTVV